MSYKYKKGYPKLKTLLKSKYLRGKKKYKSNWNGVPATVRKSLSEKSLYETVFASIFCHFAGGLIIWAITFSIIFFGLAPKLFPKPKIKDIEFNISGHSHHRARHSRAKAGQTVNKVENAAKETQEPVVPKVNNAPVSANKSKTKTSTKQTATKSSSNSVVPDFSMDMPSLKSFSSGAGASKGVRHSAAGFESSAPSIGNFGDSPSGSRSSSGNGFDKNATKKIIATYDISPYVNELKRDIRWNWKAPSEGKRVELFLRIARDGKIVILNVKRTSEIGEVDNAALNAVRKCVPLDPLPSKYAKNYLDVVFTFDANSVGSRY